MTPEEREELIAQVEYWPRQPYWTVEEGVILARGFDPREATIEDAKAAQSVSADARRTLELFEVASRAVELGELSRRPSPFEFVNWHDAFGSDAKFPQTLATLIRERVAERSLAQLAEHGERARSAEPLNPRERGTLLKLLLAALYGAYAFRPGKNTKAVSELADDTTRIGHPVSAQTIRKFRDEAIETFGLPQDVEPD